MNAAIYARKSTTQDIADDQRSVTRQIEHARAFAAAKGWTVADEHVFSDDGISGAEFDRPGLARLMNAVDDGRKRRHPPFQVLVVSDLDRIGRELLETGYLLKQLAVAGVRVFTYLDDREVALDSPTATFLMQVQAFGAALEREKGRQRTTDAMVRKARALHVTGGRCFGYVNLEISGPDGKRSHVERRVQPEEAGVVRRIFQMSADGIGLSKIVKTLNDDGVPAPRPQRGRPQAWATSSVRAVLLRAAYRGLVVWNKTKKRNVWGQARRSDRPEDAWVRVPAPDLRIVSDELWEAAQAGFAARRQKWGTTGRPDLTSRFLLSGFARCGVCGGSLAVHSREHGRRRRHFYACTSFWKKGAKVCTNNLIAPVEKLEQTVLAKLESDILDPEVVEEAIQMALAEFTPARDDDRRAAQRADLAEARQACERLADAIARGGPIDVLVERLRQEDGRRKALEQELRREAVVATRVRLEAVEGRLRAKLADVKGLLRRNVADGREVLRALLQGPLTFAPVRDARRRGYQFEGEMAVDKLVSGIVDLPAGVASPAGFEPAFWP